MRVLSQPWFSVDNMHACNTLTQVSFLRLLSTWVLLFSDTLSLLPGAWQGWPASDLQESLSLPPTHWDDERMPPPPGVLCELCGSDSGVHIGTGSTLSIVYPASRGWFLSWWTSWFSEDLSSGWGIWPAIQFHFISSCPDVQQPWRELKIPQKDLETNSGLVMENSAPGRGDAGTGHVPSCVFEWNTEWGSPISWKAPCIYAGEVKAAGDGGRAGKQGHKGIASLDSLQHTVPQILPHKYL